MAPAGYFRCECLAGALEEGGGRDDLIIPLPKPAEAIFITPAGLAGRLQVPERAVAAVIFAHGSGSSRHSPRNHLNRWAQS